jgi:hypothetical protein
MIAELRGFQLKQKVEVPHTSLENIKPGMMTPEKPKGKSAYMIKRGYSAGSNSTKSSFKSMVEFLKTQDLKFLNIITLWFFSFKIDAFPFKN